MKLPLPRQLFLRLALSVVGAFLLAMGATWVLQGILADRDAEKLINRVLDDVQDEIEERVDRRLVKAAMTVRDRLPTLPDTSIATLRSLADELRVDEICLVDADGILYASAREQDIGLSFHELGGQAAEFLALLDDRTELAQPLVPNSLDGELRKYVGVWVPSGGFVQVGCLEPTLRRLAQTAVTGLTHNRHVGGVGKVIIEAEGGEIISDARESGLEGSQMPSIGEEAYRVTREIDGFRVHAILPKSAAALERKMLVGTTALLTMIALVFVAVFVGLAIAGFVREQLRRQLAAEMEMAREIQLSSLPDVFPPFPGELRLDIFARMDTTKEVGGDFYDFYFIGPDRLACLIADVSGKGVPAAMFMMKAKTIIKDCVNSMVNLADAMTEANARLCEDNEAGMFVTCWIGAFNLRTGVLEYVNAGHNPPFVRRSGGALEALRPVSGLFLGGMKGVRYRKFETQLVKGELLYLYTDGVTEAVGADGAMFGEARLEQTLANALAPERLCARVKATVDDFATGMEQADDITMLALRYRGEPLRESRMFKGDLASLQAASAFVEERLAATGCPERIRSELLVAVDEIGNNIASYSGSADMEITVERAEDPPVVRLTFSDSGRPWDPLAHLDPDVTVSLAERTVGGLGIMLVKKLMDDVSYEHRNGRNILSLRKMLPWDGRG